MRRAASYFMLMLLLSINTAQAGIIKVPPGYKAVARSFGIPPRVFFAIALTESRKKIYGRKIMPWPWTLNVEGKGIRYANKKQAFIALSKFIAQNKLSVDIGLMQVNWKYHSKKLKTPWLALNPYYNMRVSAQILTNCYASKRDWWVCVGRYHSPGQKKAQVQRAEAYRQRVKKQFNRVI